MTETDKHLVTAALPYANGPLHLGHLAGAYLGADAYVRFLRLQGKDVAFICGSDEYGAAISIKAKKEGTTPQQIVDKYHNKIKSSFEELGVDFSIYHRTTSDIHRETAQEFFRNIYHSGGFEEIESEQFYDEEAAMFLADRFIVGTCPKCGFEEAYGDQCENCGSTLSPNDLKNPRSKVSGTTPVLKKTKHWFLSLQNHESWLREWISDGVLDSVEHHDPAQWKKHVIGQCLSWIDGGLEPRSMTRDLDWGIDVPQEIEGSDGKKLYVWLDAPIGYISATKEWARETGKDWKDYWQSENSSIVHFIGKDNIVFHCVTFPVILKTHGGYNLPTNVPANQFMNLEGRKLSTSKGWAVWVHEYLEEFKGKQDELRYTIYKYMPEQKDSEFTWKGYQEAVNGDLVNNLGNFINRVLVLTHKYYEGVVPEFDEDIDFVGSIGDEGLPTWHDSEMLELFDMCSNFEEKMRAFEFREAIKVMLQISSAGNQILQSNEPWKAIKEEPDKVAVVMNIAMQYVATLSVLMRPFIPFASNRLRKIIALDELQDNGEMLDLMNKMAEGELAVPIGHKINVAEHLFEKVEDHVVEAQIKKLEDSSELEKVEETPAEPESKPNIAFEDFTKLDLKTAKIISAEKVKGADRLLKLELEVGKIKRTVVSGIAESFTPQDIIGQEVLYLSNLEPRKIKGVVSQGMVLMADSSNGKLGFVAPPKDWETGLSVT